MRSRTPRRRRASMRSVCCSCASVCKSLADCDMVLLLAGLDDFLHGCRRAADAIDRRAQSGEVVHGGLHQAARTGHHHYFGTVIPDRVDNRPRYSFGGGGGERRQLQTELVSGSLPLAGAANGTSDEGRCAHTTASIVL